ncbi:MAG: DNA-3-methyladenine glycosylase I [Anaerolineales bacterium]
MMESGNRTRCFGQEDPLMADYHDSEWGVPVRDRQALFEHLSLDIFQAGLSWRVILNKRDSFREAFLDFRPEEVAKFDQKKVEQLMGNPNIVRNRKKIGATIANARALLAMEAQGEGFSDYLWDFVGGEPQQGPPARTWEELPTKNETSAAMASDLKAHGFQFVGPTVCYAFMQAVGMIDDHLIGCFRYRAREK